MIMRLQKILIFFTVIFISHSQAWSQIDIYDQPIRLRFDSNQNSLLEGDSILKYFIRQAHQLPFSFKSVNKGSNWEWQELDKLFPVIEQHLYSFLNSYEKESISYQVSMANEKSFTSILEKINFLKQVDFNQRNQIEIKQIFDSISCYPNTRDKVVLRLWALLLTIPPTVDKQKLYTILSIVREDAELINDGYERGIALTYLADFFAAGNPDFSIELYYAGYVSINTSEEDSLKKYHYQAEIYEKISDLFKNTGDTYGTIKQSDYYLSASKYFQKSGDGNKASESFSKYISIYSNICTHIDQFKNTGNNRKQIEADVLRYLKFWYVQVIKNGKKSDTNNSRWFNSIGTILLAESKLNEAKAFFLFAAVRFSDSADIDNIRDCLKNISLIYALENNNDLALNYSNLLVSIEEKYEGRSFDYIRAILNKAKILFVLKQYDSSIIYQNIIIRSFQQGESMCQVTFPYQMEIGAIAYELKFKSLEILKRDSVLVFKNLYNEIRERKSQYLITFLQKEASDIATSLNSVKSWETSVEKSHKEMVEALNKKINHRNVGLIVALLVIGISLLRLIYFYRRSKKQEKLIKKDFDQTVAFNSISTHDIKKLAFTIPRMLKSKSKKWNVDQSEVKKVIDHAIKVAKYIENIVDSSDTNTTNIKSEIERSKKYAEHFQEVAFTTGQKIDIVNRINDPYILKKLLIPTFLLNYFIKNSIEHGFADETQKILNITVDAIKTEKNISIMIDDDGCGINYYKKFKGVEKSKGMKRAIDTIAVFNESKTEYSIIFNNDCVIDKSETGEGNGTRVIINFIPQLNNEY